ncbi:hypothetical protein STSO111631_02590 [Stackebrandtia soli]
MTTLNYHLDLPAPVATPRIVAAQQYQEDWRNLAQRIVEQARTRRPGSSEESVRHQDPADGTAVMRSAARRTGRDIPWLRRRPDGTPVAIFVEVAPDHRPKADSRHRWVTFYLDGRRIPGPDAGTSGPRHLTTGRAVGRCPAVPADRPGSVEGDRFRPNKKPDRVGPVHWDLTRPISSMRPPSATGAGSTMSKPALPSEPTPPEPTPEIGPPTTPTPGTVPVPPRECATEHRKATSRDGDAVCLAHVPRRSGLRRLAVRLFGPRAARRDHKVARCRSCRSEWPCPTLVEQLCRR